MKDSHQPCPDCTDEVSRRKFVQTTATAVAAGSVLGAGSLASAAPTPKSHAETVVTEFYKTLSAKQKKAICFKFDHPKRKIINANWRVTKPQIEDDFFSNEQRELLKKIVQHVTSKDGYERLSQQMEDDYGGLGSYSCAVFGTPGTGEFQWLLTGRHLTLRADGDSVKNVAFGGPIVYGHGESDVKDNLFYYQTKKANEVFAALDPKHRKKALLQKAPRENAVPIQGDGAKYPGLAVGELSSDQQDLVEKVIKVILAPYRTEDVDEALAILKKGGGLQKLHMAFYKQGDIGKDMVWDIWRLEGPSFVWHFRGAPHVHTYVNIGLKS